MANNKEYTQAEIEGAIESYKQMIEMLELQVKEHESNKAKYEKYKELKENPLYKELIEDGYLEDEKNRIADMIVNPTNFAKVGSETYQEQTEMLHSIKHYRRFFIYIEKNGIEANEKIAEAKRDIESYKENIDKLNRM